MDNNTCFYVGKGHGKRYKTFSRNTHHDRIAKKYGMKTKIIYENLSECEAYHLERKTICKYVFDLGYGIDIDGYRKKGSKHCLTNSNFGGKGNYGMVHSSEWRKQHSEDMQGEKNPMYGVNLWDSYSEEKKQNIKSNLSKLNSGKNNPMFGISPKERMDNDTYKVWLNKTVERGKSQVGENNPNYGNHTLHNKIKDNPELRIQYYSRPRAQNGRAKKVELYKDNVYIDTFDCILSCAEWIKSTLILDTKVSSMLGAISTAHKNNKTYHGYTIKYL